MTGYDVRTSSNCLHSRYSTAWRLSSTGHAGRVSSILYLRLLEMIRIKYIDAAFVGNIYALDVHMRMHNATDDTISRYGIVLSEDEDDIFRFKHVYRPPPKTIRRI